MSTQQEPAAGSWQVVARFENLPTDGTGITVELGGAAYAVFRVEDSVYVVADTCPHEGASLGCGVISRGDVTCPWHGWHFDLETGASSDGLSERIEVFPARVDAGGGVEAMLRIG